ncbi:hypothetical protein [Nocardioides zhouii]|uniref:Calcium-binding protein n=1 Tax=Nocardioides zhouii TaxID=1168729 RepID=A0A4Q2TBL9_9ACTN|nr:hypothetical protein [Nocardioides zhouii]RYC14574.1 hypothetical protein EUA94_00140 [Nocardioides zhouii]
MSITGTRRRVTALLAVGGMTVVLVSPAALSSAAQAAAAPADGESAKRIGVLALAGAISAVGQTPQLTTPLPFTDTSLADVLGLDASLTESFDEALQGTNLQDALEAVEGITVVDDGVPDTIAFTYERTVTAPLALVHDDGDLRFGRNDGAGNVTVALETRASDPFVVAVDLDEPDPLLRVALVSQPVMDLSVDIDKTGLTAFDARQGFTDVGVTGGRYQIHRDQVITMRDPDGRGVLTLEDLRYSTLPDLFRVETGTNTIDVRFNLALPTSLSGGTVAERTGLLAVDAASTPTDGVWPSASDADRDYGDKLTQATDLSMVDGLTSLAQYTGTVLALQDAADVPFPNLGGGTSDLFAPGDRLLDLLSTAAAAQVVCGLSPENPPIGIAAPGDTVYCQATTAQGLGNLTGVSWSLKDSGSIVGTPPAAAVGQAPSGVVEITGSDGEPDLQVSFTAQGQQLTARSMPHTVQEIVARIKELGGLTTASASLGADRLDVSVGIAQATGSKDLDLGNPGTVGALVGLTGLRAPRDPEDPDKELPPAQAEAVALDSTFDVGFGIQTGDLEQGEGRATYLLPNDASLLTIANLEATPPSGVTDLPARIGFLQVKADLTELGLGKVGDGPAVELTRVLSGGASATAALPISDLLTEDGALDTDQIDLTSAVTASIAFTATEEPLSGSTFATGPDAAEGEATVSWSPTGLPTVTVSEGYIPLRVFDPVPAAFFAGTAAVSGNGVRIDVSPRPDGRTLYDVLNVPANPGVEVARRLIADGAACQNVTIVDDDSLTCQELAPDDEPAFTDGQPVNAIVLGDPFAMRDSVIEGLATTLAGFDRLAGDNVTETPSLDFDQYTSTLPLVDLTPAQLAVEREALSQGIAAFARSATEDEVGTAAVPVSSAQELARAVTKLVKTSGSAASYTPELTYSLGSNALGISLEASAPADTFLAAPLRFDDAVPGGRGQVASGPTRATTDAETVQQTVPVKVVSTTTLAINVSRTTARPVVAAATGTDSRATVDRSGADLDEHPLTAGVSELAVIGEGSSATLGVQVLTDYDATNEQLQTQRRNLRDPDRAATADLPVGVDDVISYAADATDSSGGAGAAQPAPDAMQVRFLAEGLDGLAAALGSAMDGAAPRNLDPETLTPISAPLIGTNLDAGAGVPDTLTTLTSSLRDEFGDLAIDEQTTGAALKEALEVAVATAITDTDGLADVDAPDVAVTVTCGTGEDCDPAPCAPVEPLPGEEPVEPEVCTTDTPTGWETVTVGFELENDAPIVGETPFQTGLAGLEVRSVEMVDTTTNWTLPVTLQLKRGVGPQVVVGEGDQLLLDVEASLPEDGIDAIVGYLPARLSLSDDDCEPCRDEDPEDPKDTPPDPDGGIATSIVIEPAAETYDLFDLYDGELKALPAFAESEKGPGAPSDDEAGLSLDFQTITERDDKSLGTFGLSGYIDIPWSTDEGFDVTEVVDGKDEVIGVTYNSVKLDVGDVAAAVATPFAVVDPYLAPVRDVIDVLRTPIPVISDLSELAGGDEVSLLFLLETLAAATEKPQLELATRVIGLVEGAVGIIGTLAPIAEGNVELEALADVGALLTVQPSDVALYGKCTETVSTSTTTGTTTATKKAAPQPCPDEATAVEDAAKAGAAGQTTGANRAGARNTRAKVAQSTRDITGQLPGFTLPFLSDPDQLVDVLTGEGEVSYFRLDLGTLAAQVAYSAKFGPIMAGPVPIVPFVGGSISVEGRLAMGFDSYPQTLAARSVSPGDVSALIDIYKNDFDGGDVIREGFYVDDLDADGVDVPEVALVTTLEAGAGVSIGIVTAGLKGGITLSINLDINDPDDDGRLRTAEIRDVFSGDAACIFDASAELEAFISIFVEIELLLTSLEYEFDILRLGPYTLFEYGCPDRTPRLVYRTGNSLTLTSGDQSGMRYETGTAETDKADDFEVRQFDRVRIVDEEEVPYTAYEISGFGRVQNVEVTEDAGIWTVQIYQAGITLSTEKQGEPFDLTSEPTFEADGGVLKDKISFLTGEEYEQDTVTKEFTLATTPFTTSVTRLTGGVDDDVLVSGEGNDSGIDGGDGNDSIETGLGNDVANGGIGNDVVGGGAGRDDLTGGDGDDRLEGGPGGDRVNGEAGGDSLVGGPGRDVRALLVLPNGSDDDVVARQVRLGFDSGDVLVGGGGGDVVDGGDGGDVVVGGEAASLTGVTLGSLFTTGTRRVDVLVEGVEDDDGTITPDEENTFSEEDVDIDTAKTPTPAELDDLCISGDEITGAGTTDFVTGGPESDVVVGGNAADTLDGGDGPDEICGRGGDDQISGDSSDDDEDSDDVIRGGADNDRADGGPGNDVMFGDDVTLVRGGERFLDGSLGDSDQHDGDGRDFLDGGDGGDIVAGGDGSDLLVGGLGDDATYGEGQDTTADGGAAPALDQRLLACNQTTRVVRGLIDLDGDLYAGEAEDGLTADTGQLAGLDVTDGVLQAPGSSEVYEGLLGSDVVVLGGQVDLDRDGNATGDPDDTGFIDLPSMLGTGTGAGSNSQGDCILAGEGNDELRGGTGSDYLGAGDGTDLGDGGDGNDLLLGDDGTDVLLGGPHHDVIVGGLGDDHLQGENGDDRLRGNEGYDDLVGGSDTSESGDGQDVLLGGREDDVLVAENGVAVSRAIVDDVTDAAVPWNDLPWVPDAVTVSEGSDLVFDSSAVQCSSATPTRWLTTLVGDGVDGTPAASPGTADLAYDELYGGFGCDVVIGSTGRDLVRGGQDSDLVEGGPGSDFGYGDDGDDVVIGGSTFDATEDGAFTTDRDSAGVADGGDVLRGDGGPDAIDGSDLVAGDNALPIRVEGLVGPDYVLRLHDVATLTTAPSATTRGGDILDGGGLTDRLFGQGGADTIRGDLGDDYVEGNDGGDTITGGDGADDIIGGSSTNDAMPLGGTGGRLSASLTGPLDASAAGLLDGGTDVIDSGAGADVVLGDNGRITRPTSMTRHIARADEAGTTGVSDADLITGGTDADRLFGQGGNDVIDAGSGEDHVEGNEGADGLTGGADADVIIGGSSLSPDGRGTLDDAVSRARTQLDGNDVISGDVSSAGAVASDLILGDNATVLRLTSGRLITQLADVATISTAPAATPAPGTSGADTIWGGSPPAGGAGASDRVFGQGGNDRVTTGSASDYVEGNSGTDTLYGGSGDDDLIGGSSATNGRPLGLDGARLSEGMTPRLDPTAATLADELDTVYGGGGNDTVLGDNGRITRPTSGGHPVPDVAMADTANALSYGSDLLLGEDGNDTLYGQLDDGVALGSGDRLEGGTGNDTMLGDLATVKHTLASTFGPPKTLTVKGTTIAEAIYVSGSFVPETYVPQNQAQNGGPDVALGGDGNDAFFLGNGNDIANGEVGMDTMFGGDDDDILWGGADHDRLFGGYGADDLDLKDKSETDTEPVIVPEIRDTADEDGISSTTNGKDFIYGGYGPDEMQADVGSVGRDTTADQMIDWVGAHNVYYVCNGAYGQGKIIRESSPDMMAMLTALADASGSRELSDRLFGGFWDLGLVNNSDRSANTAKSPEYPGNFATSEC